MRRFYILSILGLTLGSVTLEAHWLRRQCARVLHRISAAEGFGPSWSRRLAYHWDGSLAAWKSELVRLESQRRSMATARAPQMTLRQDWLKGMLGGPAERAFMLTGDLAYRWEGDLREEGSQLTSAVAAAAQEIVFLGAVLTPETKVEKLVVARRDARLAAVEVDRLRTIAKKRGGLPRGIVKQTSDRAVSAANMDYLRANQLASRYEGDLRNLEQTPTLAIDEIKARWALGFSGYEKAKRDLEVFAIANQEQISYPPHVLSAEQIEARTQRFAKQRAAELTKLDDEIDKLRRRIDAVL